MWVTDKTSLTVFDVTAASDPLNLPALFLIEQLFKNVFKKKISDICQKPK